jgi:hypothetical protein
MRPIAGNRHRAYVMDDQAAEGVPMSKAATAATPRLSRPLLLAVAAGGLLVAATLALWAHYGTAVFYEMILAGLALCL